MRQKTCSLAKYIRRRRKWKRAAIIVMQLGFSDSIVIYSLSKVRKEKPTVLNLNSISEKKAVDRFSV